MPLPLYEDMSISLPDNGIHEMEEEVKVNLGNNLEEEVKEEVKMELEVTSDEMNGRGSQVDEEVVGVSGVYEEDIIVFDMTNIAQDNILDNIPDNTDQDTGNDTSSDGIVFNKSVNEYIIPLLCPHYHTHGTYTVHPDNITAFKVVSDVAYNLIMASLCVDKNERSEKSVVIGETVDLSDSTICGSVGSSSATTTASSSSGSSSSSSNGSSSGSNSNDNSGSGSGILIQDLSFQQQHVPASTSQSLLPLPVIDVTSHTFRCGICYDEIISKRGTIQVSTDLGSRVRVFHY